MSVESLGRLGALALTLLEDLADQAVQAGGPSLSRAAFISGALQELSIALCRGNAYLSKLGAYVATRTSGHTPVRSLAWPLTEVVMACLAPGVCAFWVFLFGFALRYVALLCAVYVRWHLVFFPAGRPFVFSGSLCRKCIVRNERAKQHRHEHGDKPTQNDMQPAQSKRQARSAAKPRISDSQPKRGNTSPALHEQAHHGSGTINDLCRTASNPPGCDQGPRGEM
jgi:hypothetical protein